MKNMDYRLDLINQVKVYNENLTEDDVLMVVMHNKKDGDLFNCFSGDWQLLSAAFTTPGYINFDEGDTVTLETMQKSVLNIAYNICMSDKKVCDKFKEALFDDTKEEEPLSLLEFNEGQQAFHYNDKDDIPETFGWRTIGIVSHKNRCRITDFLEQQSGIIYGKRKVSFKEVKVLFDNLQPLLYCS